MKILYLTPTPTLYGDNKAILNLISELILFGIEPFFVTSKEGDFTQTLEENNYRYSIVYTRDSMHSPCKSGKDYLLYIPRMIKKSIVNYSATKRILKLVREFNPDLIHSNVSSCDIGYRVAKITGIPHVWHVREMGKKDKGYDYFPSQEAFERKLSNPINKTIFITKTVRENFNLMNDRCSVIYDGVFKRENILTNVDSLDRQYFLYVGRVTLKKGILSLLDAYIQYCERISDKNLIRKLVIAGDAESIVFRDTLLDKIHKAGIVDKVSFIGYQKQIKELMQGALALIVPSEYEAFGFITAEAMYYGCLVIGRDVGGTREQMDNVLTATGTDIALRFNSDEELVSHLTAVSTTEYSLFHKQILLGNQAVNRLYSTTNLSNEVFKIYKK